MSHSVSNLRLDVYDIGVKDVSSFVIQLENKRAQEEIGVHCYRSMLLYRKLEGVAELVRLIMTLIEAVDAKQLTDSCILSLLGLPRSPEIILTLYDVSPFNSQVASYCAQIVSLIRNRYHSSTYATYRLPRLPGLQEQPLSHIEKMYQCAQVFASLMLAIPEIEIRFFYKANHLLWDFPVDWYLYTCIKEYSSSFIALPYTIVTT